MTRSYKGVAALAGASAALMTDAPALAAPAPAKASVHKAHGYADGVYSATGQYGGLPSSLVVRVRLGKGVVTHVEVGTPAKDPTSLDYQKRFAAAVPAVVVGRPIDQIKVGKLAGASGCPDGFNAALVKIRAEAAR